MPESPERNEDDSIITGYVILPKYRHNLKEYLELKGRNDPTLICKFMGQTLDALEILHETGRTYNDLKPENIMVTKDEDGDDHIVLIDFGLADKYSTSDSKGDEMTKDVFSGNLMFASTH